MSLSDGTGLAMTSATESDELEELFTPSLDTASYSTERHNRRIITPQMIVQHTGKTKNRNESVKRFFKKITHLHLSHKGLVEISNLDTVVNLRVLYLYGNAIEKVENLDFATRLTHLYLQNNRVTDFPREGFSSLQKLFLDGNQITTLTGLEQATNLEELHLKHQQLQEGQCLTVSMDTLHALSYSLRLINVAQNAMVHFDCFQVLSNLEEFYGQDNQVVDLEQLQCITRLPRLRVADFRGNPACKTLRYRDAVIGVASAALEQLDGTEIAQFHKVGIQGLERHRRKIEAKYREPSEEEGELRQEVSVYDANEALAEDVAYL